MFKFKSIYSVVAVAAALAVFAPAAQAKVFSIPAEDAIATINAPDAWEPNETDKGVEMNSPDRGIYIDVEAVKADDISGAVAETVKLLASQGLVLDRIHAGWGQRTALRCPLSSGPWGGAAVYGRD